MTLQTTPLPIDHDDPALVTLSEAETAAEMIVRCGPVTGWTTVHSAREIAAHLRGPILQPMESDALTAIRARADALDQMAANG
jgi:hypothetical protein